MDGLKRWSWPKATPLVLVLLMSVFAIRAWQHGERWNRNRQAYDQSAYLHFAQRLEVGEVRTWTDGARGPAYPLLLRLIYRPSMSDEMHFHTARRLNIVLSLMTVLLLGGILFRWLPRVAALTLWWITTCTVLLFRAPYVQPEPYYFLALFVGFFLSARSLVAPTGRRGLGVGVALGVAHLLKPAALPAVILFVAFSLAQGLVMCRRRNGRGFEPARAYGRAALAATIGFAASVMPHALANERVFGQWFYNVNTTFYIWYDSWEEAKAGTRAHGDRRGWPDMPANELPSLRRYFREHSPREVLARLGGGVRRMVDESADRPYAPYVVLYSLAALLAAAVEWRHLAALIARRGALVGFVVAFFSVYLIAFAWFGPINYGERLLLSLFLPWLTCSVLVIERLLSQRTVMLAGQPRSWSSILHGAIGLVALLDGISILGWRILTLGGGT